MIIVVYGISEKLYETNENKKFFMDFALGCCNVGNGGL